MAQNGTSNDFTVKAGLAQMLKGGVIMDVVNAEQVRIRAVYAASNCFSLICSFSFPGPHC
jgi:pyridoxal 5'-phosphate synthase pdxS subunit